MTGYKWIRVYVGKKEKDTSTVFPVDYPVGGYVPPHFEVMSHCVFDTSQLPDKKQPPKITITADDVGKKFKTRSGGVQTVVGFEPDEKYCPVQGGCTAWTVNGRLFSDEENPGDLIERLEL